MNVPKLRFKEFNDEWDYKIFDELINIKSESYNPSTNENGFKCIELEHINQNSGTINGYCNSKEQKSNKNIFKKDEVLFGKLRPYLKKYWYSSFEGVCSSEIWVAKSKNQNIIINKFIYDIFQSHYFLQLCNLSTGSKMPRADWSFIKEQSVAIPCIKEQNKISDTLELLDKKIELQSKKIEDLKLFKKGLNKKVYNSIENKLKLENICNFVSGYGFPEKYQGNQKMNIPFFKVSDMNNKGNETVMHNSNNTVSQDICNKLKYKPCTNKAIIFAKIGAAIMLDRKRISNPPFLIDNNMMAIYIKNENVSFNYLYHYLFGIKFSKYTQQGALPSLSSNDLGKIKIPITDKNYQNKISKLFDSITKKIDLETKTLNTLKELKKGLMQNMFV